MAKRKRAPVHPGKILLEEFMKPLKLSQYRLAKELRVSPIRISQILHGKRGITADTAIRLGALLNMDPLFWMNLQNVYDLDAALSEFYEPVYQKITPLSLEKKELKNKGSHKPGNSSARSSRPLGKTATDAPDFSTLLQQGLNRFFLNFQIDKKLRK